MIVAVPDRLTVVTQASCNSGNTWIKFQRSAIIFVT